MGGDDSEFKVGTQIPKKKCLQLAEAIPADKGIPDNQVQHVHALWHLSDKSGELVFTKSAEGDKVEKSLLKSDDVFILDYKHKIYLWLGKKSSKNEKAQAFNYANKYCIDNKRPTNLPTIVVKEA